MGEIRSPYFSNDGGYLGDNAEIHSPYFSSGGDYIGDNAEIDSPYSSFGTRDYHGDNAGIQSSYFSVGDYCGEEAEIPSQTFFHQDHNLENPYNAEQVIGQTTYNTAKLLQQKNVEELRIDMEDEMAKANVEIPDYGKCIYKVPDVLRRSKEDIFTPRQISIGPIHHGMKNIWKPMKEQKVKYFQAFCNRVAEKTKEQKGKFMDKLSNTIIENKENIKQCYEDGAHEFKEYEFLKVVLLDAVFILEYLLRNEDINKYEDEGYEDIKKYKDDFILSKMRPWIRWDLILLENQLPFFILEKLYLHLVVDGEEKYTPFRTLACAYFNRHIRSQYKPSDEEKILHFTDLVRSLLSFSHPNLRTSEPIVTFYSATQLVEATIKIKESRNQCLLDVKFTSTKGELSIPRLQIDSTTECIFRNLMAFERCHYPGEEYICHYIKLFDTLILKPKDADLLIKNKIIRTNKDGARVEKLIKKLSEGTFEDYSCYYDLYQQLDKYYQKSWMENSALYFRKTYFGNVWKGTATVTAAILLVLTFVQTICSVLSLS